MTAERCRYCGLAIKNPARPGRPPDYCSVGCRRAAEYDVRRASRRLDSLECRRDDLEVEIGVQEVESRGEWQRKRQALEAQIVAGQIDRYRDRLRLLLDEGAPSTDGRSVS